MKQVDPLIDRYPDESVAARENRKNRKIRAKRMPHGHSSRVNVNDGLFSAKKLFECSLPTRNGL